MHEVSHSNIPADSGAPAVESEPLAGAFADRRKAKNLDGNAIDAARWAALRKSMAVDVVPDSEDEDIILLRQAEEEEERRQEEERLVWQASKAQAAAEAESEPQTPGPEEKTGEVSEDDDFDLEAMRLAEEEEERRQQAEREAFLARRAPETK
jgi:hypothetical protein